MAVVAGACVAGAAGEVVAELILPELALVGFFVETGLAAVVAAALFVVEDDEAGATSAVPELTPAAGAPAMLIALVLPN